jgi:hypothetical protein
VLGDLAARGDGKCDSALLAPQEDILGCRPVRVGAQLFVGDGNLARVARASALVDGEPVDEAIEEVAHRLDVTRTETALASLAGAGRSFLGELASSLRASAAKAPSRVRRDLGKERVPLDRVQPGRNARRKVSKILFIQISSATRARMLRTFDTAPSERVREQNRGQEIDTGRGKSGVLKTYREMRRTSRAPGGVPVTTGGGAKYERGEDPRAARDDQM